MRENNERIDVVSFKVKDAQITWRHQYPLNYSAVESWGWNGHLFYTTECIQDEMDILKKKHTHNDESWLGLFFLLSR